MSRAITVTICGLMLWAVNPRTSTTGYVPTERADNTEEITIVYSGYESGRYRLILDIAEDRSVSLKQSGGVVMDLDGNPLRETPDDPDGPEDPPGGDDYSQALLVVQKNFADADDLANFERQSKVLSAVMVPGTAETAGKLWEQSQIIIGEVINGNAPQWEPWLKVLTGRMEVDGLTVEAYERHLAEAKASLE